MSSVCVCVCVCARTTDVYLCRNRPDSDAIIVETTKRARIYRMTTMRARNVYLRTGTLNIVIIIKDGDGGKGRKTEIKIFCL